MYYVYILKSQKDKSLYKGYTTNIKARFEQHNSRSVKFSSTKAPYELAWYCAFKSKNKALKFEQYLKKGSGHAFTNKRLV